MARAAAELLAVSVLRGPVPGGGCTANPPPAVPGVNSSGDLKMLFVLLTACRIKTYLYRHCFSSSVAVLLIFLFCPCYQYTFCFEKTYLG